MSEITSKRLRQVLNEEIVLKSVYESGLHQQAKVLFTRWKDGIDIDEPTCLLMNFCRKLIDNLTE